MSLPGEMRDQVLCTRQALHLRKVPLTKNLAAALRQPLPFGGILLQSDKLRQHLVAAHADERPHAFEGDVMPGLASESTHA